MSAFWSGWVIVLTVANILGCFWLIWWTMRRRAGESAQGEVTGHKWDGDLEEYNNPLPRWWLWLFYITLFFAAAYLALYPGLGGFQGLLGWSSHGSQYEAEMQRAAEKYDPIFQQYAAVAVTDLATKDEYQEARDMGKRLFLTYCMQCHGSDAGGARGFPSLRDDEWLWGASPDAIRVSIAEGRIGMMPAHPHLSEEQVEQLAHYVVTLAGRESDPAKSEAGKELFMMQGCIGCHGMDGTGNQLLGAPNLTNSAWTFGGSLGVIKQTIAKGRNGVMPGHKDLLSDEKIHLLTAYTYSLKPQ